MATYIKTLKEDNGDITYPQTKASAVLLNNNSDLEAELATYVTAEDIASVADLNHPITTGMIADGAVTPAKLTYSTYGRFARDNDNGSQAYAANTDATALLPNALTSEVGCSYSAGVFTISQPGIWLITGGARASSGASNGYIRIKVNGESVVVAGGTGYATSSVNGTYNAAVVWVGHLAANDTVNLEVRSYVALTNNTAKQQHLEGVCIMPD